MGAVSVSTEAFMSAMANLAGGVVIVTTSTEGGRASGMTATAVCSVSIDPPLVMACMKRGAATHRAVEVSGVFALNLLPARSEALARRFASNRRNKFEGVSTMTGATGAPILDGMMAHCECTVEKTIDAGDHTIFIGRVRGAASSGDERRRPLLYLRGDYGSIGPLDIHDSDPPSPEPDGSEGAGSDGAGLDGGGSADAGPEDAPGAP